jgi:hypothetical protein
MTDDVSVYPTQHAVERYQERVRPGLGVFACRNELEQLLRDHGQRAPRPEWMSAWTAEPAVWVTIGPDIWLPCEVRPSGSLQAMTVLCRGSLSERRRRERNATRRHRARKHRGGRPFTDELGEAA